MRCAWRNKTKFWYANFADKKALQFTDEWGNVVRSGEFATGYEAIKSCRANISASTGEVERTTFGTMAAYDKVIILDDPKTDISENTVLWLEHEPEDEPDSYKGVVCGDRRVCKYDHVVRRVARTLHGAVIAVSKVTVNE